MKMIHRKYTVGHNLLGYLPYCYGTIIDTIYEPCLYFITIWRKLKTGKILQVSYRSKPKDEALNLNTYMTLKYI